MTSVSLVIPYSDSRWGWPQNKRLEELSKLLTEPAKTHHRILFKGENKDLTVIRVSIYLPKYRLTNGRTTSLQSEYLARNQTVRRDLFTGDPELIDAQQAQDQLLSDVIHQQGLHKFFEDSTNKQSDPILLDERGFVVNGNRRLCCWRKLLQSDSNKYGHFDHIDVIVLPHCDDKEIDRIEAHLQIEKDIKADYSWDARANMLIDKQKRDQFSSRELAELYRTKESEIKELIDMRQCADEYLRSRDKADMWSLVSEHEEAFRKIATLRPKIADVGRQMLFLKSAFTLVDNPKEAGGRLYEQIPAILSSLDEVAAKLLEEFPVEPSMAPPETVELFGGSAPKPLETSIAPLVAEISKKKNACRAREIIVETVTAQKELKKNSKLAKFLFQCCRDANTRLSSAVMEGLRPESDQSGVSNQLYEIEKNIAKIRKYLEEHVAD